MISDQEMKQVIDKKENYLPNDSDDADKNVVNEVLDTAPAAPILVVTDPDSLFKHLAKRHKKIKKLTPKLFEKMAEEEKALQLQKDAKEIAQLKAEYDTKDYASFPPISRNLNEKETLKQQITDLSHVLRDLEKLEKEKETLKHEQFTNLFKALENLENLKKETSQHKRMFPTASVYIDKEAEKDKLLINKYCDQLKRKITLISAQQKLLDTLRTVIIGYYNDFINNEKSVVEAETLFIEYISNRRNYNLAKIPLELFEKTTEEEKALQKDRNTIKMINEAEADFINDDEYTPYILLLSEKDTLIKQKITDLEIQLSIAKQDLQKLAEETPNQKADYPRLNVYISREAEIDEKLVRDYIDQLEKQIGLVKQQRSLVSDAINNLIDKATIKFHDKKLNKDVGSVMNIDSESSFDTDDLGGNNRLSFFPDTNNNLRFVPSNNQVKNNRSSRVNNDYKL